MNSSKNESESSQGYIVELDTISFTKPNQHPAENMK